MDELPFQYLQLDQIEYNDLQKICQTALQANFKNSSVEVVQDHPDFTKEPWNLAAPGISGDGVLLDIGGPNNLHYGENHNVTFNIQQIAKKFGKGESFVMGPGAVSAKVIGFNAELIANSNLQTSVNNSKSSFVTPDGSFKQDDYHSNEIGVLANLLSTEGKSGQVIKVTCSVRTGPLNFISCIKRALAEAIPDKTIGLAGVFLINKGKIRAHVMPDFPKQDILCKGESDSWLKFYEMGPEPNSPLVCISVLVSNDKQKLELRQEHTHFYSKHGHAGHYHYDTTPDVVQYEGYFVLCQKLYRVAIPTHAADRTQFFKD